MGSSNKTPIVLDEAFQQYLEQNFADQARVFQIQMDTLTEQFRRFTRANVPPNPPNPPPVLPRNPQPHLKIPPFCIMTRN